MSPRPIFLHCEDSPNIPPTEGFLQDCPKARIPTIFPQSENSPYNPPIQGILQYYPAAAIPPIFPQCGDSPDSPPTFLQCSSIMIHYEAPFFRGARILKEKAVGDHQNGVIRCADRPATCATRHTQKTTSYTKDYFVPVNWVDFFAKNIHFGAFILSGANVTHPPNGHFPPVKMFHVFVRNFAFGTFTLSGAYVALALRTHQMPSSYP
jgi:hypothetical protein